MNFNELKPLLDQNLTITDQLKQANEDLREINRQRATTALQMRGDQRAGALADADEACDMQLSKIERLKALQQNIVDQRNAWHQTHYNKNREKYQAEIDAETNKCRAELNKHKISAEIAQSDAEVYERLYNDSVRLRHRNDSARYHTSRKEALLARLEALTVYDEANKKLNFYVLDAVIQDKVSDQADQADQADQDKVSDQEISKSIFSRMMQSIGVKL